MKLLLISCPELGLSIWKRLKQFEGWRHSLVLQSEEKDDRVTPADLRGPYRQNADGYLTCGGGAAGLRAAAAPHSFIYDGHEQKRREPVGWGSYQLTDSCSLPLPTSELSDSFCAMRLKPPVLRQRSVYWFLIDVITAQTNGLETTGN